ncbi:hypothetical protein ACFOPQ_08455 [Deinococcus antarcticus]|uniref:Type 4 fimbrial biogenesis protein PilX N-terminal domain-containing protein n=1 Tax=Deinococcus antarcticus TaxID=1298767 RepID=A0ABV8A515_9DEIO
MKSTTSGYTLVTAIIAIAFLMLMLMVYGTMTLNNMKGTNASRKSGEGYYASEAGLNQRASEIKNIFASLRTPTGISPTNDKPCQTTANQGNGDFACKTTSVNGRSVKTYLSVGTSKPGRIPQGDSFEGLNAIETPYTVVSRADNSQGNPEAITNLIFRVRLVPLFQFAVFFDKDLEFSNTAPLDLSGPVHTNGNLFLDSTLTLRGQVTGGNTIYDGWKSQNYCKTGTQFVVSATSTLSVPCGGGRTTLLSTLNTTDYAGRLKRVAPVQVPTVGDIQPRSDATYWQKADVRIVLKKASTGTTWTPYFVRSNGTTINTPTGLTSCTAAVSYSTGFRDNREGSIWDTTAYNDVTNDFTTVEGPRSRKVLLNLNVGELLNCIQVNNSTLGVTAGLANITDDGLVIYATLDDSPGTGILTNALNNTLGAATLNNRSQSNPPVMNNYGVRLTNGNTLRSTNTTHPAIKGITFVTDQAIFIQGDFNSPSTVADGWKPASIVADTANVLSNDWSAQQNCRLGTAYMNPTQNTTAKTYFKSPDTNSNVNSWTFLGSTWRRYTNAAYAYAVPGGGDAKSAAPLFCRLASPTTIRAAILAGTASTGEEGQVYNNSNMVTSGGVHNMMRFHEEWGANGDHPDGDRNFTYQGSLVSLSTPLHSGGTFYLDKMRFYNPPNRIWSYEDKFNSLENLPPLTPRFVTAKQENFSRAFNQ